LVPLLFFSASAFSPQTDVTPNATDVTPNAIYDLGHVFAGALKM
jgi:hypothetical protein